MNTMTPSAGRTRKALAMATPSKNVCSSRPTSADVPATRLTACVSSPKWKWGVSVCCVRCTARYPASTSPGAAAPERAKASGSSSTSATARMNPAPTARKRWTGPSARAARRVTASAPATLPTAATRAYSSALDTSEQLLPRVARRVVEHVSEQPRERLAHLRPGPHARGDEIVPGDGEVLEGQGILGGADRLDHLRERGAGSGTRREQDQQVVGVLARLGEPFAHRGQMLRVRVVVPPPPDRAPALDVLVRALEARQERGRIRRQERRDEHWIAGELVEFTGGPAPRSPLPDFRQPDPRRPDIDPQGEQLGDTARRPDPLEPLVAHALGRELRQTLGVALRGLQRARVDAEVEARAEAQRPQDPEIVLLEPPVRVAHRANQLLSQVVRALEGVAPLVADRMVGDRVDREVAAREVVGERDAELHHGVPAVGADVPAERGDLVGPVVPVEHRDGAVLDPHGNGALEQAPHCVRGGGGREIEVVVLEVQQVVADRAAHAPGLEAGLLQRPCNAEHFGRDGQTVWKRHPERSAECGMRNAELLALTFRIPHFAFRIRFTRTTHSPRSR